MSKALEELVKLLTEECEYPKPGSVSAPLVARVIAELRRLADIEHEHRTLLVNEQNLREELAAIKASLGEPVAQIVYASDDCGTVEWLAHSGRPIRVGQKLYALTNKDQS